MRKMQVPVNSMEPSLDDTNALDLAPASSKAQATCQLPKTALSTADTRQGSMETASVALVINPQI